MRYIGVDLHTAQITVCYLTDQGHRVESWKLSEMPAFCEQLTIEDEMAVEATGNTRWFCEQVKMRVKRVWVVNPREFQVIRQSARENRRARCRKSCPVFASRAVAGSAAQKRVGGKSAEFAANQREVGRNAHGIIKQSA